MSADTVTTTVRDLYRILTATRPAVDPDEWREDLSCIHLTAGGGILTATATNRYIAVHARAEALGHLQPTLLHRADATVILRSLRTMRTMLDKADITIERLDANGAESPRLAVTADDRCLTFPVHADVTGFPVKGLATVFARPASDAVIAYPAAPDRLVTVAKIVRRAVYMDAPAQVRMTQLEPNPRETVRSIRVDVGNWLAIVAVGATITDMPAPVPYGLPAGGES